MAVPSSGNSISLAGLAAEKEQDDYTDVDYDDVLSLKDITIGGNANGNSFVADLTNGFSASHPNNVAPFKMSEFYSYDHDASAPGCNLAYHDGGQGNYTYPINLGNSLGIVTIEYQAYGVPDKFVFTWNGNTYTSGSGNGTGAGFVGAANHLSALQATAGNSSATITTLTTSYGSGSQNGQNGGRGTITFNKTHQNPNSVMTVSAPLSGTAWWFSVSCPGQQVIGGGSGIAPTVVTNGESSVSSSGFTMNGNVTSKGTTSNFSTTGTISARGFVLKAGNTTDSFIAGQSGVTVQQADTNNSTGTFSKAVGSLVSNSTYTYRAYATNAAGTSYGINDVATTSSSTIAIPVYSTAVSKPVFACGQPTDTNWYFPSVSVSVGDQVYTNNNSTATPSAGHYGNCVICSVGDDTTARFTVNSSGVVTAVNSC